MLPDIPPPITLQIIQYCHVPNPRLAVCYICSQQPQPRWRVKSKHVDTRPHSSNGMILHERNSSLSSYSPSQLSQPASRRVTLSKLTQPCQGPHTHTHTHTTVNITVSLQQTPHRWWCSGPIKSLLPQKRPAEDPCGGCKGGGRLGFGSSEQPGDSSPGPGGVAPFAAASVDERTSPFSCQRSTYCP